MFPCKDSTLNNSLGNAIFPSQRLVTTSASFTHSNWITLSYSSSPKHKRVCFLNVSLTSVCNNLEHGLVTWSKCTKLTIFKIFFEMFFLEIFLNNIPYKYSGQLFLTIIPYIYYNYNNIIMN